ncbi:MAG: SDR family oxidoreductase [Chloroflexi bacterium]|jgi:3-oxoacyl-[acyl-carrier protein] reductase|nr:SDR family oxidoreductase [Chloroflexota bacterium]
MDLELNGKVAVVTAASKGLGKATALALAREGAHIAMSARSEAIESAAAEIRAETNAQVITLRGDIAQQSHIDELVNATLEQFGQIDILFVNAGGPPPGNFLSLKPEDWEAACNLTLMSAVRLCYAVVPHMIARGEGSIIAAQSVSVKQPIDNLILSNSLRMAVIGLFKSLANELGPKGIRVNTINPTYTWTERVEQLMNDRATRSGRAVEEITAELVKQVPLGRMGTTEEFGRTVAWLASPAASFIHGQAIMFDGGMAKSAL